jgi:hypothetical protein
MVAPFARWAWGIPFGLAAGSVPSGEVPYVIVGTGQTQCYDDRGEITPPKPGQPFYGQDAQFPSTPPSYKPSADGLTVHDINTGLTWMKALGHDTSNSKYNPDNGTHTDYRFTYDEALAYLAKLNAQKYGGYDDWRLPSIKEQLSIALFIGDARSKVPFFDSKTFDWVDVTTTGKNLGPEMGQTWSSTGYVGGPQGGGFFFYNYADGHLKRGPGRPPRAGMGKANLLRAVRGPAYGINAFQDNGDDTITDTATGLMWSKNDSGAGMDWKSALAWVQQKNAENHLGHNDWRLPQVKELQGVVDYTRAPAAVYGWGTPGAAIDPRFNITSIPSSDSYKEYPWFWSSTSDSEKTHRFAYYVCFGRARSAATTPSGGHIDTHGAGAVRTEPKCGNAADWSRGLGPPPSDEVRIDNFVRLVRNASKRNTRHE